LIQLSSSPEFDSRDTRRDLSVRLSSLPVERLDLVFASIPPSTPCLRFKIALCTEYLKEPGDSLAHTRPNARPKAQARPRPVFASATNISMEKAPPSDPTPTTRSSHGMPLVSEVLGLLDVSSSGSSAGPDHPLRGTLCFELLRSFGMLQVQDADASEGREEWSAALKDGRIARAIDLAFPEDRPGGYRQPLTNLLETWRSM
jgi:hypothetical protein